jgi:hypothetical protein
MAEALHSPWVGVAVDVYHVWWDPCLKKKLNVAVKTGTCWHFMYATGKFPQQICFSTGFDGRRVVFL